MLGRRVERRRDVGETLIAFLDERAEAIARTAARSATELLPVGGRSARKNLRTRYAAQLRELARLLSVYGFAEAPHLYGEHQRRAARERLLEGLALHEAIEESFLLVDATLATWNTELGPPPPKVTAVLAASFGEVATQSADVWLAHYHAEGAAFQEAALLETIVHHLDEAIVVLESDGTVSYATPAIERIAGLPTRALMGSSRDAFGGLLRSLEPCDHEGKPIDAEELPHARALRSRAAAHEEAMGVTRPDGGKAVLEIYAAPVFDEDETLRGVILTVRDRTERVAHLRELEEANDRMRSMYARLLSRSRLEAVGELAGRTAHALNNQLNVIGLRVRRLRELPESAEEAEGIERAVREIASLVGRLQELASTRPPGSPEPVDLDAVCREALDLNRTEIGPATAHGVEVRLGHAGVALAERDSLLELVTTLLLAARDTTPAGGSLAVETEGRADRAIVRVTDGGQGVPPEALERIFEPLAPGVSGRVLSLVAGRQAAERWGGELRARSRPGGGIVFEVILRRSPVAEEAVPARPAPPEVVAAPAAPAPVIRRVLVVDDDADNAEMLADLLREAGAEPEIAGSGGAALEAMRAASDGGYDAALVDLLLPDVNGWEVVRALKERRPGTRVAVVSGLAAARAPEAKLADAVFRKPLEPDRLLGFLGLPG